MDKHLKSHPELPNVAIKKAAGAFILDGKHIADTMRCVHCSAHWVVQPGSRKQRGWCVKCQGALCGSPLCTDACIPLEMRLQGWERDLSKNDVLKELDSLPRTIRLAGRDLSHL